MKILKDFSGCLFSIWNQEMTRNASLKKEKCFLLGIWILKEKIFIEKGLF